MGAPTIYAGMTRGLVGWARARGLAIERMIARAGLDPRALEAPDGRVPRELDSALWIDVERELGDASFGLAMAEAVAASPSLGVVGLRAMTSPTLREAVESSVRHHRLLKDDAEVRLSTVRGALVIEHACPRDQPPWTRPMADFTLATYLTCARRWTGRHVRARAVFFRTSAPPDPASYEAFFGGAAYFGQPSNALVLDEETLALGLSTARADVAASLEALARSSFEALPPSDFVSAVRDALRAGAERGDVGLARVARSLGTSARTLQRRLAESGHAYQALVDDARRSVAFPWVTLTDTPVDEVSNRLGYSDAKAFRRAFRRWTGVGPREARRLYGGRSSGDDERGSSAD